MLPIDKHTHIRAAPTHAPIINRSARPRVGPLRCSPLHRGGFPFLTTDESLSIHRRIEFGKKPTTEITRSDREKRPPGENAQFLLATSTSNPISVAFISPPSSARSRSSSVIASVRTARFLISDGFKANNSAYKAKSSASVEAPPFKRPRGSPVISFNPRAGRGCFPGAPAALRSVKPRSLLLT